MLISFCCACSSPAKSKFQARESVFSTTSITRGDSEPSNAKLLVRVAVVVVSLLLLLRSLPLLLLVVVRAMLSLLSV